MRRLSWEARVGSEDLGQEPKVRVRDQRDSRHHGLKQGRKVPFDHEDNGQEVSLNVCFRMCSPYTLQRELQDIARRWDPGH